MGMSLCANFKGKTKVEVVALIEILLLDGPQS